MATETSTASALLKLLKIQPNSLLIFESAGQKILPGYHVTEVKHARIKAVDCGRTVRQWDEIHIQLLDGATTSQEDHMLTSKFLGIVQSAIEHLPEVKTGRVVFEFAPGNGPLMHLGIDTVEHQKGQTIVKLTSSSAVCKPFELAKASLSPETGSTCCRAHTSTESCACG